MYVHKGIALHICLPFFSPETFFACYQTFWRPPLLGALALFNHFSTLKYTLICLNVRKALNCCFPNAINFLIKTFTMHVEKFLTFTLIQANTQYMSLCTIHSLVFRCFQGYLLFCLTFKLLHISIHIPLYVWVCMYVCVSVCICATAAVCAWQCLLLLFLRLRKSCIKFNCLCNGNSH